MVSTVVPLFVFSLPRSGSTLIQRILAAHESISTVSESHILLPYLYTLKDKGVYSEYYHKYTVRGIQAFCLELPNGVDDYLAEIRSLILRLYTKAAKSNAKYFLDKAGAYHLIVDDIFRLFPEGKFIFLWRNPLAVVSSLMESWRNGRWNLYEHEVYLYDGAHQLVAAYEKYRARVCAVRFEDLIINPDAECRRILGYLELPFDPEILSKFSEIQLRGELGDRPGMRRYQHLSREPLDKWKHILANPIRKAWCKRYLRYIGKERLAMMGYDIVELLTELNSIPSSLFFLGSDILRIPYGLAFRLMEGRIMKDKLQAILAGQRVYLHH